MQHSKVVPLRPAPGRPGPVALEGHGGGPQGDLSQLALRARGHALDLAELARRLENHPQVRLLARRLARSLTWHGPDDLLQTALERVVRGIRSYRGSGDILGWTARIMRNAQVEWMRREAHESSKLAGYARETEPTSSPDPAQAVSDEEIKQAVRAVWCQDCEDPNVRIFWDRAYVGLSVEQIMRRTGHPRSTVYSMLKRGEMKFLRDYRRLLGERRPPRPIGLPEWSS
jgi:RNA polymerase sigma factor (sigma-70 family)